MHLQKWLNKSVNFFIMIKSTIFNLIKIPKANIMKNSFKTITIILSITLLLNFYGSDSFAHNVDHKDQNFLEQNIGANVIPYIYLGAKHMVTGYDHLLYLAGIIFFLFRIRDIAVFVSLFALGHSITLLTGTLAEWYVNPYLVDAVIGFSVVYKAFENLGGFKAFFRTWLDTRAAVFVFGLVHGLGLSTKLQDLHIDQTGLITNMLSFNIGVELGQLIALYFLILLFTVLRRSDRFQRHAALANILLMTSGFMLMGLQITGYITA